MELRQFDLALLPALDALLRERNVTRAAETLHVSQQALSSTLHRLRVYFDDELLTKSGRQFELTPLGNALVVPVRETLLAAKAVVDTQPTFDPLKARQSFTIAISDYAALVLLSHLLRRLELTAPGIQLIVKAVTGKSLHQLAIGELDLCFVSSDLRLFESDRAGGMLRSEVLFEDDFVVLYDAAIITIPEPLSVSAYRKLRHGIAAFDEGAESMVQREWRQDGGHFEVAIVAPTFSGLACMLPGTSCVATVQRRLAEALAPRFALRVVECPLSMPRLAEAVMWHGRHDGQPAHQFLLDSLRVASREIVDR